MSNPTEASTSGFHQHLDLFDATMLVAGSMIGSGIFIVSADIARDVGSAGWLLLVWILSAVMTVLGALAYAELAAMMPHAGGQYVYLREAYGSLWGFLYGWTSFAVIQTGTIAAVAVAFSKFLGVLVPSLGTGPEATLMSFNDLNWRVALPLPWLAEPLIIFKRDAFTISAGQLIGVAIILFLTWWNNRGLTAGKKLQNFFTVAKIGSLAVLILVSLITTTNPTVRSANYTDLWGGIEKTPQFASTSRLVSGSPTLIAWMVVGGAMVGALFSSDAWNNITFTAGEVKRPHFTLPASLILGTGLVTGLYLAANVGYLSSLPIQGDPKALTTSGRGIANAESDRVGTAILELAAPGKGATMMAIAIMISTFGCMNGLILMGARLTYAMARDHLFFNAVGKLNSNGVPGVALWLQAIWSCILVFSGTYNELLDYVIFAALLFYALTVAGLFVLRFRRPDAPRPYKALGYPVLPALYVFLCTAVMIDLLIVRPVYTWPGLILVLSGIPVYLLWKLIRGPLAQVSQP